MTELLQFFRLLYKNRLTLILVPLLTLVLCFFLVRELPDQYKSHGSIATGLVDKTEQVLPDNETEQESEINRKFDNLIQMMTLKKVLDQVSYQLILHDLKAPIDGTLRKASPSLQELSPAQRKNAIAVFSKKLKLREELFIQQKGQAALHDLLEDMHYDHVSLQEKITIYRLRSSDYINIDYEAENPELTAFVINTLGNEFISFYSSRLIDNNLKAVSFLGNFLSQKREALNGKMNELRNYKIQNRVLNLNEQARSLYGQIADFETKREAAEKDVLAYAAAVKNIDNKFNPSDRRYLESTLAGINQNIVSSKQNLKALNDAYIRSNFDPKYKASMDSIQNKLTLKINEATDSYIYSPLVIKENLVAQKLNMEIALELSTNSISSIVKELVRLNTKFDGLVPNEAKIQEYETGIDIASKEYIEALQRFNNATLESSFPAQLKFVEKAMPGSVQPSKKMVLLILSGIISLSFCIFVFFILYYLDNSIRYPQQLANATEMPVLGYLNYVNEGLNLSQLGDEVAGNKSMKRFRDLVRSVRYELDTEKADPKIIAVSSLVEGDGKTLLVLSLAWAFSKVNKTVLVIDGNFNRSQVTKLNDGNAYFEDFVSQINNSGPVGAKGEISFLGNKGHDISLAEVVDQKNIQEKFVLLKSKFDVILIETDSLKAMNKAKEWISFSDLVIVAFEAGRSIHAEDSSKLDYLRDLDSRMSGWIITGAKDITEQTGKIIKQVNV